MAKSSGKVTVKKTGASTKATAGAARTPSARRDAAPAAAAESLRRMRDEIDRVFASLCDRGRDWPDWSDLWSPFASHPWGRSLLHDVQGPHGRVIAPRVEVAETDGGYEITAEIPGVAEKDIEITLGEGMLTLKGETRSESEEKKKNYHVAERSYGTYQRTFAIPSDVDADKIEARFEKGVLHVALPRSSAARSKQRRIDVKAA